MPIDTTYESVHVVPLSDLKPHSLLETCKCAPAIKTCEHGRVVVHNAYDGREFWEAEAAGGH